MIAENKNFYVKDWKIYLRKFSRKKKRERGRERDEKFERKGKKGTYQKKKKKIPEFWDTHLHSLSA